MRVCVICKKGSKTGGKRSFLRSHYNPTKTLRRYPNLQWATLPAEALAKAGIAHGKRVKICAKCLKKLHK
ncbi:MAG: hypothetical protein HYW91_02585 [Candidatus Sungbacteria bacterium]|nr:hypothetical protein [Candidatus Sungbacteria bacterium]